MLLPFPFPSNFHLPSPQAAQFHCPPNAVRECKRPLPIRSSRSPSYLFTHLPIPWCISFRLGRPWFQIVPAGFETTFVGKNQKKEKDAAHVHECDSRPALLIGAPCLVHHMVYHAWSQPRHRVARRHQLTLAHATRWSNNVSRVSSVFASHRSHIIWLSPVVAIGCPYGASHRLASHRVVSAYCLVCGAT